MIPCKKTCADYYEGCHKNCERWKHFLQQSSAERKEKKAYLNAYNELCSTIVRQCRAIRCGIPIGHSVQDKILTEIEIPAYLQGFFL